MEAEPAPTIEQQIREVEAVYLSREAQVRQRKAAISAGRDVPPDTGCITSSLPTLAAALKTLCTVRDHQDAFRAVLRSDANERGGRAAASARQDALSDKATPASSRFLNHS